MPTYCVTPFTHTRFFLHTLLYAGVEAVMLDNEHGAIPPAELKAALAVLAGKARAIVRPEVTSVEAVERYWDLGARCFLLPKVEDLEILAAVAARVGELAGGELDRLSVIPLIESQAALDRIEQIAAIPQVGTLELGPFDLARDLGVADFRTSPAFVDLMETQIRRIAATGKGAGLYMLPDWAERLRDAPLELISLGVYEIVGDYLKRLPR
ncbi:MAG: aldolase/citrate lyase family protein [Phenylobacterium sp.]